MSCPKCNPLPSESADSSATTAAAQTHRVYLPKRDTTNVVLVGNPNVGKSSLFNALTGMHQTVVNAPGTTVEVFTGFNKSLGVRFIDTPGTYSLVPNSPDESVVVQTLAGQPGSITDIGRDDGGIDLVVTLLDASALSRSLYLLAQVAQTGLPVAVILTMQDVAAQSDEAIDADNLSCLLGVPVATVNPRTGEGLQDAKRLIVSVLQNPTYLSGLPWDKHAPGYNSAAAAAAKASMSSMPVSVEVKGGNGSGRLLTPAVSANLSNPCGGTNCQPGQPSSLPLPELITEPMEETQRAALLFDWIENIESGLRQERIEVPRATRSDKVDRVLLNPFAGTLLFMLAMYVVFWLANTFAAIFQDPLEGIFDAVGGWDFTIPARLLKLPFSSLGIPNTDITVFHAPSLADGLLTWLTWIGWDNPILQGLLINGLLTGVGVVLSFAPLMLVMFAAIAVMEDSGYMARVAFLGDRMMRAIGLDGRVIMPFIVGFGCNLPTLAALRTVPDSRQRMMAVILTPYITCSARMIVYMFIAQVFFGTHATEVVWLMYFLSIVMVVLGGLLLRPLFMRNSSGAPLMLVLPAYQTPRGIILIRSALQRTWAFLKGAGKVIVVMTIVIWLLMVTPVTGEGRFGDSLPANESAYGVAASVLAPVFAPAGFGDWHLAGSLITGFVAKETMLGALAATYTDADISEQDVAAAQDEGSPTPTMRELTRQTFIDSAGSAAAAPVAALAFLIFVLTYTPCLATVAEQWRQLGTKRVLAAVGGQLVIAWLLAVAVFQLGRIFV
ncbi:ferrous iron transport protein B [uncultured Mobiluncus sp.]|uniref:ferrous iron transport protein B n=1 Tax=uncultured Mobiluncus sp. TaxID=293425 RepID=UPI0025E261E6|nr:ferrous iron transport protein B [uncultured Mobiluncus sp.]